MKVELDSDVRQARWETLAKNLYTIPFLNPNYSLRQMESNHSFGQQLQTGNCHLMMMRNSCKPGNYPESHPRYSSTPHDVYKQLHLQTHAQRFKDQRWEDRACFLPSPESGMFQWNNPVSSYHPGPQDPRCMNYQDGFDRHHPYSHAMGWNSQDHSFLNPSSSVHTPEPYSMGHHSSNLCYNTEVGTNQFLTRDEFSHHSFPSSSRDSVVERWSENRPFLSKEKSSRTMRYPTTEPVALTRQKTEDLISEAKQWDEEIGGLSLNFL